ncbi:ribonucleotide monophosphatase NagD (HAD superfamily) [Metabacillus malikii]|uniref:Ribonucleotide monophosphatase NagD (HAD superfamily) n=1 Tax=Metabacillus malikii TaxID=1504265 RepID=A0ABT9ZBN3_9BACI|nr:ribonucleotide monophosphatase NagD (HAD superfamily) [Metabacillus malikii]
MNQNGLFSVLVQTGNYKDKQELRVDIKPNLSIDSISTLSKR